MTKEELQEECLQMLLDNNDCDDWAIFIQKYSDQETQRLKAELAEKEKLYSDLLFRYDERSKGLSYYQKLSINLQSELTELKEKHKGDVMDGYNEGYRDGESDGKSANPNDLDVKLFSNAEQYYNETHKTK